MNNVLPKINATPSHELTIPSTGQKINFRPYLVKEEKILLLAFESNDNKTAMKAMVDTILACISEPLDPSKLATFDIEYMFTQIRSKSVGESAKVNVKCEECDTENEIAVDLGTAEVEMPEDIVKKVEITEEVSVELKFPSYEVLYDMKEGLTETAMTYDIVNSCIDAVVTEDERIDVADVGKEELNTFIESMNGEQFKRITDFVQQMPILRKNIQFKCKNCGHENDRDLQGITDFFS